MSQRTSEEIYEEIMHLGPRGTAMKLEKLERDSALLKEQIRVSDVAFQALFERSRELEKERDGAIECANKLEAECLGYATDTKEAQEQLSTFRTGYQKALEALEQSISIAEDALDYRPDDEDGGKWQTIKAVLSTPLAISVKKGEV